MKRALISLTLVFLFIACRSSAVPPPLEEGVATPPDRDLTAPFQTDQLRYTLVSTPDGLEVDIPYVFTNPTQSPVYFVNCNGATSLALETRIGEQWVTAWEPVVEACLSEPIVVPPGGEYRAVIHVFGAHPEKDIYPKFLVDPVPGLYRLVWRDVLQSYNPDTYPFGEPLPLEQRISSPFRVDAP